MDNNWISTEEEIPKSGEEVLTYSHYGRMCQRSWELHTDQTEKWFKEKFTHWMPLPSPPQSIK